MPHYEILTIPSNTRNRFEIATELTRQQKQQQQQRQQLQGQQRQQRRRRRHRRQPQQIASVSGFEPGKKFRTFFIERIFSGGWKCNKVTKEFLQHIFYIQQIAVTGLDVVWRPFAALETI